MLQMISMNSATTVELEPIHYFVRPTQWNKTLGPCA